MSRIGNKPITVPENVEVTLDGNKLTVKGPKGTLVKEFHPNMKITVENKVITVTRPDDEPQNRSLHGLTRTLINNMIDGVVNEYTRALEINGVGYRAAKQGNKLVLTLGYSHPVEMVEPEGIKYEVPTPNQIIVRGMDKELVGEMAGHLYFRDKFIGNDDGIYAGLRLVEILSKTNKKCTELLDNIPVYYSTDENKVPVEDAIKDKIVSRVEEYAKEKGYNYLTIDGVKVLYDDGFALVRKSNTTPNITTRYEAKTKERLEEITNEYNSLLDKLKEEE